MRGNDQTSGGNILLYHGSYPHVVEEILHEKCIKVSRQSRDNDILYLVPSYRKARKVSRDLVSKSGGVFLGKSVYSLNDFLQEVFSCLFPQKIIISDFQKISILGYMLTMPHNGDNSHKFSYFKNTNLFPGLPHVLSRFISHVKQDGIHTVNNLKMRIQAYNGDNKFTPRDEDIIHIFGRYQKYLSDQELYDKDDITRVLFEYQSMFCDYLEKFQLFILEGFYDFTTEQKNFIKFIFQQVPTTLIWIDYPYHTLLTSNDSNTYDIAKPTYKFFFEKASKTIPVPDSKNTSLAQRKKLFQQFFKSPHGFKENMKTQVDPGSLCLCPCIDRRNEIIFIARKIRQLINNNPDMYPGDICITFPQLDKYRYYIEEIFPRFGIPYIFSDGILLLSSPWVCVIFNLLDMVESNFERTKVTQFFNSPLVSFTRETSDGKQTILNPLKIDAWAREAGIVGGEENLDISWFKRFEELKTNWETKLEKFYTEYEDDTDDANELYKVTRLKQDIQEFEDQVDTLKHVFRLVKKKLEPMLTPREFVDSLISLSATFSIRSNIFNTLSLENSSEVMEKEVRASRKLYNLLEQFGATLEQLENRKYPLTDLVNCFRGIVHEENFSVRQDDFNRVQVSKLLDIRVTEFMYIFFGGLTENDFPLREPPEILYPPRGDQNRGLVHQINRVLESQLLFQQICLKGIRTVFLSYPLKEKSDEEISPSIYWHELKRIGVFTQIGLTETNADRKPVDGDFVSWKDMFIELVNFSETEFLKRVPGEIFTDPVVMSRVIQLLKNYQSVIQRDCPENLTPYDGIIRSGYNLAYLEQQFFYKTHIFSSSQLDEYSLCPFKFFCSRVLRIKPLEEVEEEITPLEKGRLLHDILCRFLQSYFLRETPVVSRLNDIPLPELCKTMLKIAAETFAEYPYTGHLWDAYTHILTAGLDNPDETSFKGLLLRFIEYELSISDKLSNTPKYFEAYFGPTNKNNQGNVYNLSHGPLEISSTIDNNSIIKVQGKIDRIDILNDNEFYVFDYKTGSTIPSMEDIKNGLSLQLPIYILAAKNFLESDQYKPFGAGYYKINPYSTVKLINSFSHKKLFPSEKKIIENYEKILLNIIPEKISKIVNSIYQGFFPTSVLDKKNSCGHCHYSGICRQNLEINRLIYENIQNEQSEYFKGYWLKI